MNQRLKAISALVPSGTILADIGTDHGYLPIDLVKRGICPKAYACDVAKDRYPQQRPTSLQSIWKEKSSRFYPMDSIRSPKMQIAQ